MKPMMRAKRCRNRVSPVKEQNYNDDYQQDPSYQKLNDITNKPASPPLRRQIGINYLDFSPDGSKFLVSTTDSM